MPSPSILRSLLLSLALVGSAASEGLHLDPEKFPAMDRAVESAIRRGKLPGGVLWLERKGEIYRKAYGKRATYPRREAMTLDSIFDAASLTKVVATTPSILKLVEMGTISLDDRVHKHLPELRGDPNKSAITIRHLMTHTSGLLAGVRRGYSWSGYENGIALAAGESTTDPAGTVYRYSDINYILLGEIVRRVSGQSLDAFSRMHLFGPLKMVDTRFLPPARLQPRIAPTTRMADQSVLRGVVHDPTSRPMGGIAGHAGLFTTAADLARYARMMLNEGELDGVRVLKSETVRLMSTVQSPQGITARRGLGFDIDSPYAGPRGKHFPIGSFGHTGWTGTSLWIDPFSQTFVIFLSNRNHPSGGNVVSLRYQLGSLAADAVAGFNFEEVAGALPALTEQDRKAAKALPAPSGNVLNGIDVLVEENFATLKGLKIGLATNQTGISRSGRSTIDLLHKTGELELVSLFGPEHGIRGTLDGKVADGLDKKTGLPVHSLYAGLTRRKPLPEHLAGLDALVFDMQDIGCRFFTYISTMGLCMEAAEEAGIKFVVLDRVNPIGGVAVDGPVRVGGSLFTSFHKVAVRHGMTMGELARLYQVEHCPEVDLTVVPLKNWRRSMYFDQTGLPWVKPSPNMPHLPAAILYPGIGLLEFTNLSVGRGTKLPFELVGAPFIDPDLFAKEIRAAKIPGLQVVPVRFTPESSVHAGVECGGVRFLVKDRDKFPVIDLGLVMAQILRRHYPAEWDLTKLNLLLRHPATAGGLVEGLSMEQIKSEWRVGRLRFSGRRQQFLLYR